MAGFEVITEDPNGNRINISYQATTGMPVNTSSRITSIQDTMTVYTWQYTTINGQPHVSQVWHGNPISIDAQFTYETRTDIVSPFTEPLTGQPLTRVLLKEINFTGAPNPFKFEYNSSAELTKITVPHKGYIRYEYVTASFSNGARKVREVDRRIMAADGTPASEHGYLFTHPAGDSAQPGHTMTTLYDGTGATDWLFHQNSPNGWDNGLEYQSKKWHWNGVDYTFQRMYENAWTQDNPAPQQPLSNPRIASVTTILEDISTTNTRSKVERDVDANGNVTAVREYGYGAGAPGPLYRYTETTYLSTAPYIARNILNRPTQISTYGVPWIPFSETLTTFTYDNTSLIDVPGITQYEAPSGVRGNPTTVYDNGITVNHNYDIGGNLRSTVDAAGHTPASATYQPTTGLVDTATSGGSTTTFGWNTNATLGSVTGSNSDTVSFVYSSYRPTRVNRPDNSYTAITYQDATYPLSQTETRYLTDQVTVAGVTTTTFDGFGRVIKVARKENDTTWVSTETQYAPCACGPMGKAIKSSRPYRTGQTAVWTETQYDALGRPIKIIYPDAAETNYTYSIESNANWIGTLTLVTDPAGKRKRYLHDAFRRLIRVEEPDAAGTLTETARYSYNFLNLLKTVQMGKRPDETFKQTRSFTYNGGTGQLLTATNPENGTVIYTYFADGLLEKKTDAKNQTLWFFYDVKHRLLRIESPQGTVKTTFTYDTGLLPTTYANGRMTSAKNDGYTWHFAYDIMGRVTKQTMQVPDPVNPTTLSWFAQAQYVYDGDGRLKDLYYPAGMVQSSGSIESGTQYQYSYNLLGQATGLAVVGGSTVVQGVQYNAAGQLTQMQEWTIGTPTLTRSYNDLRGWVTRITALKNWPTANETVLDLNYSYLANGRVSAVNDVVNPGQSVSSYEYDELNRLTKTVAGNWSLQWTYDEFGNRLTQTKVPGSSGTPPEITLSYNETTNRITTGGYTFDLNGNLTAMPSVNGNPALTMTWDVFDRAATISTSTKTYSMKYDAFGRRVEKYDTSLGTWDRRWSFWDMSGRLLAEYTWLPSAPGTTHKYFAGQRVGRWTDRTGSVRYAGGWKHYYPFGEEVTGTANDAHKFAELYRDADTGLDYAMARYNSSTVGRFVSVDLGPAHSKMPQSWNRYAYVLNDPPNNTDPTGLVTYPIVDPWGYEGGGGLCLWLPFCPGGPIPPPVRPQPPRPEPDDPDVSETYDDMRTCEKEPATLMKEVKENFSNLASYSDGGWFIKFENKPIAQNSTINITTGYTVTHGDGGTTTATRSFSVTVAAEWDTGFRFVTNPGHVLYPGTISFSANSAGSGYVSSRVVTAANLADAAAVAPQLEMERAFRR